MTKDLGQYQILTNLIFQNNCLKVNVKQLRFNNDGTKCMFFPENMLFSLTLITLGNPS